MALDEALLNAAAESPELAFFRTYEWTAPTLSLGYFQSIRQAEADPRWSGVAIVRRPTGGGAIWHHHEVTYALVLPVSHPSAQRGGTLYHEVHAAIAQTFLTQGIALMRRGEAAAPEERTRPFLCFQDRDAEDLVLTGSKVVGSAQRRRAGAVLQHGSILLAHSPTTPELPGAGDLADASTEKKGWSDRLRDRLPTALGLQPESHAVRAVDRQHARELEEQVYRTAAWNRRR
ncbi:lipoate-protein ligase A [Singulisphaera sp. GP187]|uniref:lipoate--protein ligase family protein n=1 Tax=Singulisphaera sp. GP187 TaxID=1882752 RepID=UPI0009258571|nr:lipoate--protein ligase [Singulisphaera sp. GP187]SIN85179.1 lipoate-protein ligase A [Singulisphaera sp. GP187]